MIQAEGRDRLAKAEGRDRSAGLKVEIGQLSKIGRHRSKVETGRFELKAETSHPKSKIKTS